MDGDGGDDGDDDEDGNVSRTISRGGKGDDGRGDKVGESWFDRYHVVSREQRRDLI
jgi:hypothetical protein